MENRVFFPQSALDEWIVAASVVLEDGVLRMVKEGHRYKLTEAVRVLREVSGAGDDHDLVGRVKTRSALEQLGAEILETSMLLGQAAYDVEPGWAGVPADTKAKATGGNGAGAETQEALLSRFLSDNS